MASGPKAGGRPPEAEAEGPRPGGFPFFTVRVRPPEAKAQRWRRGPGPAQPHLSHRELGTDAQQGEGRPGRPVKTPDEVRGCLMPEGEKTEVRAAGDKRWPT